MSNRPSQERMAVAYTAVTASEAIVVRGLLESAGIYAPSLDAAEPFPFNEPSELTRGTDVYVRESQVAEARNIIEEYMKSNKAEGSGQNAE